MSLTVTIHVGPYAEFLVPKGQTVNHERLEAAFASGGLNHNLESSEKVVIGGVEQERACFAPYFSRYSPPGHKPPRQMHWSGNSWEKEVSVVDLTEVNRADEMTWFERVYAAELRALAEGYGVPMRVRWGVLPSVG